MPSLTLPARAAARSWAMTAATAASMRRGESFRSLASRRALADAARWGLVPRNVALLASPPRPGRPELQVWTATELWSFLAAVESDRLHALWLLAASTRMRRGELLGLQWPDVDLNRARVAVRRSLVTVGHEVIVSEPKTAKGRRSVALDCRRAQDMAQASGCRAASLGASLDGLGPGVHPRGRSAPPPP
jgi:integrase